VVGTKILHYRIDERISARDTGEVYRAHDEKLGRDVAIKFLPIRSEDYPSAVARFDREARAASALNHPNIITIFDTGASESGRFIVMELVQGVTLRQWMRAKKSPDALIAVFKQIAKALSAAHAAGIIHRDIKPENIMVRDDGYVKVLDFGLARWETGREVTPSTKTASGTILGTFRYMSPEQARGEDFPASSDIFSLGIVLYELVTGRHPFEEPTEMATLHAIWSKPILSPRHWTPELSPILENLILHMLDREPRRRPSAEDIARVFDDTGSALLMVTPKASQDSRQLLVGRHRELVKLQAWLQSTCRGDGGMLVLIAGEPGIGKTALVEGLLKEQVEPVGTQRSFAVGKGKSSERLARTEAYLPLFEALEDVIRQTPSLAQVMRRAAPNWYDHVIRQTPEEAGNAPGQLKAGSRELLNRELMAFLEEASVIIPVVLFLDDLHWADGSTLDVIAYTAGHLESSRVFMLASYRPEELLLYHQRFVQTALDLQSRRRCQTIDLDFISAADVEAFLSLEFPQNDFPATFPKLIHTKTDGNPFFMVEVLRYLRDKQVIFLSQHTWRLSEKLPEIERDLPQSIVGMVKRKIDVVTDQDRKLLAAASVQGFEFDSAVLSRALKVDPAEVEDRLEALHRVNGLLNPIGVAGVKEWMDGTIGAAYRFVHFLYYNAFYSTIQPARKAAWSAEVAQALLHFSRDRAGEIASQLAFLFEAARDFPQAAHYFSVAADNANGVFAYVEAELLARRGLRMLEAMPDSSEKLQTELNLQLSLGIPLLASKGHGNLEVQRIHDRARQLCVQLGDSPRMLPALYGLVCHYAARLELPSGRDGAAQLLRAAQESGDAGAIMAAHVAAGTSTYFAGGFEKSLDHLGQYKTLDANSASRLSLAKRYGMEPGILLRAFEARVLWWMGALDKCLRVTEESLALARSLNHAPTLALTLALAATTRLLTGKVNEVESLAKELKEQGAKYVLHLWIAESGFFEGWVRFARRPHDPAAAGIEQMRQSLMAYRATGTQLFLPTGYTILAEAYRTIDRVSEGLQAIRDGSELPCFQQPYPLFCTPEFLRVESELLTAAGDLDGAEQRLVQALEIARDQKARICELRTAISFCKLRTAQNRSSEGREILAPVFGWFTEGFDTPDLKEAKALLDA
jgi:hypothetical protein